MALSALIQAIKSFLPSEMEAINIKMSGIDMGGSMKPSNMGTSFRAVRASEPSELLVIYDPLLVCWILLMVILLP